MQFLTYKLHHMHGVSSTTSILTFNQLITKSIKMGSVSKSKITNKPHALCIPGPVEGHINPMLKVAKLLHHNGFHITFVHTEHIQRRLLKSKGPTAFDGLPDFRFEFIPDGLPETDAEAAQDIAALSMSLSTTCLEPFCKLISKLNNSSSEPKVSCIVSDGCMSFTLDAAEKFRVPEVLFWTTSACGFLAYTQYQQLLDRGYTPLKDASQLTNGYMDTVVDWVPGMKNFRLKDFPSFIRTTDPEDILLKFATQEANAAPRGRAVIVNTFEALEHDVLQALSSMLPSVYSIGPLQLMMNHVHDKRLDTIQSSLWKEDSNCLGWLDDKEPGSVVYVNFGSITVVTAEQLTEFAWGLANSKKTFLWIIRPDLVAGDSAMVPPEFVTETKDRSMMASWCDQEKVLQHPSIGGFMTHSGWNSTQESIVGGVPVICWPFFAEQQTNCRYSCIEWEIGMEIDNDVKRVEVEMLVKELMDGEKGKKMRESAKDWKSKAEAATLPGGSSFLNLEKLIKEVLLA